MGIVVAVVFHCVERIRSSSRCVMADMYIALGRPGGLDDDLRTFLGLWSSRVLSVFILHLADEYTGF